MKTNLKRYMIMAELKPKQDKIVMILKERKIVGVTKNDAFYQYIDLSQRKYFGKNYEILTKYIHDLDLTTLQKDTLLRNILIISVANEKGHISVDWDRFFKQNTRELVKISALTIDYIKKYFPDIITKWDNSLVESEKNQKLKNKERNQ